MECHYKGSTQHKKFTTQLTVGKIRVLLPHDGKVTRFAMMCTKKFKRKDLRNGGRTCTTTFVHGWKI
jgi:hypothetical protein